MIPFYFREKTLNYLKNKYTVFSPFFSSLELIYRDNKQYKRIFGSLNIFICLQANVYMYWYPVLAASRGKCFQNKWCLI